MVLSCPSVSHLPKTFVEDKYSFISGNLGERGGDIKFHSNFHTHNLLMIFAYKVCSHCNSGCKKFVFCESNLLETRFNSVHSSSLPYLLGKPNPSLLSGC